MLEFLRSEENNTHEGQDSVAEQGGNV